MMKQHRLIVPVAAAFALGACTPAPRPAKIAQNYSCTAEQMETVERRVALTEWTSLESVARAIIAECTLKETAAPADNGEQHD